MKKNIIYIILFCCLPLAFLPYVLTFTGGLSSESERWADFGNYLEGISGMMNVLVLGLITLIIKEIENSNRTKECRNNHQKEMFHRFLNTYEGIIINLFTLKTEFCKMILSNGQNFFNHDESFKYYIKLKSLIALSDTYMEDKEISTSAEIFLGKYLEIIELSSINECDDRLKKSMQDCMSLIDALIIDINKSLIKYQQRF